MCLLRLQGLVLRHAVNAHLLRAEVPGSRAEAIDNEAASGRKLKAVRRVAKRSHATLQDTCGQSEMFPDAQAQ